MFIYETASSGWLPSDLYKWEDMTDAVQVMATDGIGDAKLWIGEGDNHVYGLVNIAAFLGQCMQETIRYNACDENNWSDPKTASTYGGNLILQFLLVVKLTNLIRTTNAQQRKMPLQEARWHAT